MASDDEPRRLGRTDAFYTKPVPPGSFLSGTDRGDGAFERIRQHDELAFAFLEAAEATVASRGESDLERFYVVMYLLRQSLELALKDAVRWWRADDAPKREHSLERLWDLLGSLVPAGIRAHEDWAFTGAQIALWQEIDPRGVAFRYPDDDALLPTHFYAWFMTVPDVRFAAAVHRRCVEYLLWVSSEAQR